MLKFITENPNKLSSACIWEKKFKIHQKHSCKAIFYFDKKSITCSILYVSEIKTQTIQTVIDQTIKIYKLLGSLFGWYTGISFSKMTRTLTLLVTIKNNHFLHAFLILEDDSSYY
jgi:hypothetical protein